MGNRSWVKSGIVQFRTLESGRGARSNMNKPTFFTLAKRSFWLLFGGIWLLVGIPFFCLGSYTAWKEMQYKQKGVTTHGEVLQLTSERGSKSTIYYVRYRFTAEGKTCENRSRVNGSSWRTLQVHGSIDVQYLSDDPQESRVLAQQDWALAIIFPIFGGVFGGVGGFLFAKAFRRILLDHRLYRDGLPAEAQVEGVNQTNMRVNRVCQYVIRYAYRDLQGQVHHAQSYYMPPQEARAWNTGDTGMVRFDSQRPDLSVWVGKPEPD
jgi:uncharacterized protein DUF3592